MDKKRNAAGEMVIARSAITTQAAPVFLQKTYDMLETSPQQVACWSDSGMSFIIKQPREFAKTMLPKYFKHNNFSSFVRQLNFYGFRKHKKDEIVISKENDESKNWWEFYHEKFIRGKQDLMCQIRRKTYSEPNTPEKEEVEGLKHSVERLQHQVSDLMGQLSDLTGLVRSLLEERNECATVLMPQPPQQQQQAPQPQMAAVSRQHHQPWPKRMKSAMIAPQSASSLLEEEDELVANDCYTSTTAPVMMQSMKPIPTNSRISEASLLEWTEASGIDYFINEGRSMNLFGEEEVNQCDTSQSM